MNELVQMRINAAKRAAASPAALAQLLMTRRGWARLRYALTPHSHGGLDGNHPIAVRRYRDMESYKKHQRSKLPLLDLSAYNGRLRFGLAARLQPEEWTGKSVLCLAARLGGEVAAFHDVGAFAVGVDLNPGERNTLVLSGDFHDLVFPDACLDAVYGNSFDHCLSLTKTLCEIRRVLKPDGVLVMDAQPGAAETTFDEWAAMSWRSIEDLVQAVVHDGFTVHHRTSIEVPWAGECIRFGIDPDS